MRALFIKLTSMGDLIHALPALTDASRAIPGLSFDWVIEKSFADVAKWHPAVNKIIPTSHRKWRKNFWQSLKNKEIQTFLSSVREERYDLVIDGQSSLKSAAVTLLAKGVRHGLDRVSSRERLVSLAYQKRHFAHRNLHAITRLRLLFAGAFNYPYPNTPPDYGIKDYPFPALSFELPKRYLVFVHNASWPTKMWPEQAWRELVTIAGNAGFNVLLPWGNKAEEERAMHICQGLANAQVLPFCTLSEQARILLGSAGAICSDTGLSHLAAALNVPAITLYGPTSKDLTGTIGLHQQHLVSPFVCTLCYRHRCHYGNEVHAEPLCMLEITPQLLWDRFKDLLASIQPKPQSNPPY
ncbi:MAG TPA: lipopolysaccharide heptosyltransferase I [Gammaproteobacteria bacterium]|nr:lipopolysaccharide heptosyltransferase I [Gammaproteobacteria bacterium]